MDSKTIIIMIFLFIIAGFAHNEYYKLDTSIHDFDDETATRTQIVSYSEKKPVRWGEYFDDPTVAKIPIELDINTTLGLNNLSTSTVESACRAAVASWNSKAPTDKKPFKVMFNLENTKYLGMVKMNIFFNQLQYLYSSNLR